MQLAGEPHALGIDLNGVLIDRGGPSKRSLDASEPVAGAFRSVRRLAEGGFGKDIHLVSRCEPAARERRVRWLDERNFWGLTGVSRTNIHFCDEREAKRSICESVGIAYFVDDRLDVLRSMDNVANRFLFVHGNEWMQTVAALPPAIHAANDWDSLATTILARIAGGRRASMTPSSIRCLDLLWDWR